MLNKKEFPRVWKEAVEAGRKAGAAVQCRPMIVGTPTTPFGNDVDTTKPTEIVADGVCGFGWIVIRPANSAFAHWLNDNRIGSLHTYGGWYVGISEFNQSLTRKEACAEAMAKVLNQYGIKTTADSRID